MTNQHYDIRRYTELSRFPVAMLIAMIPLSLVTKCTLALSDTSAAASMMSSSSFAKSATSLKQPSSTSQRFILEGQDQIRTKDFDDILSIRGGQEYYRDPYEQPAVYNPSSGGNPDSQTNMNYEGGFANYNPPHPNDPDHLFQESVQERVDKWRTAQMEKYGDLSPEQEANPRDESGRLKLLNSVGKGARAAMFFLFVLRDVHLFEVADQTIKGGGKLFIRTILTSMFVGNMAAFVLSLTSVGHATKKRLKAILNLDKLVEASLLAWYFIRLTVFPSRLVPREVFIAGVFHSVFILVQSQAVTKLIWVEGLAPPPSERKKTQTHSQEDFSPMDDQFQQQEWDQRRYDYDPPSTASSAYASTTRSNSY